MDMHRVGGRGLLALAAISVGVAVAAPLYDRPGGPALLAELNHPVLLAALAVLCLVGAALLHARHPDIRKAAGLALAGVAVLGVLAVPAYELVSDPFPDREFDVPAPDGSHRRLVVEQTSALTDPVWRIYVDAGPFPATRRWPVAQYAAPAPGAAYPKGVLEATWPDATHITLIDLDHTPHTLRIARDGRPVDELGW
ncbi:hypothetical protein OOK31_32575 [Streptomyces sp. NBC_00249]|uniref:hypothetical protein n=1 Tax=Streptomyces sp. NBC_00249 TaxID=2975690 RepID=UPI002259676B|nr:hypothetical protein [Streptomyces sp. NBC_00249]MCX5198569.1 hypothetical protein [Streptomyces sp. NBC_00249]